MKSIIIPDTEQRLNEGSIVILEKYPNTKWIVNTGWYTYGEDQFEGWYFSSIPSNTILPITDEYLTNIQILSNGDTSGDIIDPLPPEDEETEGEPVVDCNCTPTPPVQPSCPTPTPPIVIKSPEKYLGGVWYYSGQLVYLDFGDLYQTTKKFKSSWKLSSLRKNLDADVQSGYLVPVPNTLATEISEQFEGFTTDLNGFEQTLNTFEDKVTALTIRKFLMPFHQAFGTDTPTKEIADNYLSKFDPPIVPSVTVSFRNTDLASSTYGHQFTYYPMPNNPSGLLFMDDTIDTIVDISGKVDKTVAGEGGTIVKSIDTQLEDSGLALKRVSLSLENGETSEDIWKLPLASKQDINTLDNTKVDKSIAGEGETIVQNLAITETVNGFNMKKTLLSLETGEINTVSKVLPLTTKDELEQGLNELQVSILEVNNNKIDKSIAGVNQMMVKSATLSFNQETGDLILTKLMVNVSTGSMETLVDTITINSYDEAIANLNERVDELQESKIDKSIVGEGESVIKDAVLSGEDGILTLTKEHVSPYDGTVTQTTENIILKDIGMITEEQLEEATSWNDYT